MIAQTQCVGSLHAQYLGELVLWGWIEFQDFATLNLRKFPLFLPRTDNEPSQEGGRELGIFIILIPTRGFDALQMTANPLNQTSFLHLLPSLLAALSKCKAELSAASAQPFCSRLSYFFSACAIQLETLERNMKPKRWRLFRILFPFCRGDHTVQPHSSDCILSYRQMLWQ